MNLLRRKNVLIVMLLLGGLFALIGAGVVLADVLDVSLADAHLTFVGEDPADWTGYFASPAGDVNGDGLGDLIIGAPNGGDVACPFPNQDPCEYPLKGKGIAYLVLGKERSAWSSNTINLAEADASFLGCYPLSMTARQVYTAGDVNGDGYDDFLVSGWNCSSEPVDLLHPSDHTGKAFLFLGRPDVESWGTKFPAEQADASFLGERPMDFTSYYNATVGDINGDGLDDFLVTCTKYDVIENDVMVAEDVGKVYLFLGRQDAAEYWHTDFPVTQADASIIGEAAMDHFGRSAVGVGDVNGDGYDDFLVGSMDSDSGGTDAGENYLFLGSPNVVAEWGQNFSATGADASFIGEAPGDGVGQRVATAGDVNGDGYSDMVMQAARSDQVALDAGKAYLVLGRAAADWGSNYPLAQADASFLGEAKYDEAGRRVGGIGDVNADGYDDFIVGAPHSNQGGPLAGVAYLLYGVPNPTEVWGLDYPLALSDITFIGKPLPGSAGYDMGWLNDFDGDGIDDYFTVAFGGRHEADVPGEVYVLFGGETLPAIPQPPLPVRFLSQTTEGVVNTWYGFTGDYTDPSGWEDIAEAQLALGTSVGDDQGFDTVYVAAENALYLRESGGTGLIGPCMPGQTGTLTNGVVEVDCYSTRVMMLDAQTLRVTWRARWVTAPPGTTTFNAYLRAVDQAANDSGFVQLGSWTLIVEQVPQVPQPVRFLPQTTEGAVNLWYRFTGDYIDPSGWGDIAEAQLALGTSVDDDQGFDTVYVAAENALYLRESGGTGLIGPCTPGQTGTLTNGVVEVDCYSTRVTAYDAQTLRVTWRVRWVTAPPGTTTFNAYLRAVDQAANDSGFVQLGAWTLIVEPTSDVPEPTRFVPQTPEGSVGLLYWFTTDYEDPNGWQDIDRVKLVLGTSLSDSWGFDAAYVASSNLLYLSGTADTCTPGENRRLSNGVVELDCYSTQMRELNAQTMRVLWRVRWIAAPPTTRTFNAYLRAIDQAEHDSGFVQLGSWTLIVP